MEDYKRLLSWIEVNPWKPNQTELKKFGLVWFFTSNLIDSVSIIYKIDYISLIHFVLKKTNQNNIIYTSTLYTVKIIIS